MVIADISLLTPDDVITKLRHSGITVQEWSTPCPFQIEGTLADGRSFYFRIRGHRASMSIGHNVWAAICEPTMYVEYDLDTLKYWGLVPKDTYELSVIEPVHVHSLFHWLMGEV